MQTYSYHSYAVCSKIVMCLSATCPAMDHKNTKSKNKKYILGAISLGYPIQCEVLKGPPPSGCEVMDLWSFLRKAPKSLLKFGLKNFLKNF